MPDSRPPTHDLGRQGEDLALLHLESLGFALVDRNVRLRSGEIDLIVEDRIGLAFVEVKTRTSRRHGEPWEAVGATKRARMESAVAGYLADHRLHDADWRFGIVALVLDPRGDIVSLEWIDEAERT